MKTLKRNKQRVYYALYGSTTPILDSDGMDTGETELGFGSPIEAWMNVSANKGEASVEPFGVDLDYTKTIMTDDINCPIDETSRLWIGRQPTEPFNYSVVKVAKSLNHIQYAVKEVEVS